MNAVPHLVVLAALTTGAGVAMIRLGFSEGLLKSRKAARRCPSCDRFDRGPRLPNLHQATMIEPPRRHGHHDPRYPAAVVALVGARAEASLLSIAVWENEGGTTRLAEEPSEPMEWSVFLKSRFPGSRRHDLSALAAYGQYRIAHEHLTA